MTFCKNVNKNLLSVFIVLVFITESYSKIHNIELGYNSNIPKICKAIFAIFMAISLLINYKKIPNKYFLIGLLVCFCIGQITLENYFNSDSILNFFKYMFPIILFLYFFVKPITSTPKKTLFKVFESIIIFNTFLIILGFIFNIAYFETYMAGNRFGYNGLLYSSSSASYIYIISLFYFLIKLKKQFFSRWESIFILIGSIIIGTKTIFITIFFILFIYFKKYWKVKIKNLIPYIIGFIIMCFGYLYYYKLNSFTSILSYRDQIFLNKTIPYIKDNWSIVNYFFGGVQDFTTRSQMGFFDVFYFFGFIGGLIYVTAYFKSYVSFKMNYVFLMFLTILIPAIFIAGNFFMYTTIALYMMVIKEKIKT